MTTVNRQIRLVSRPVGFPRVSDFELDYAPMPTPATGGVLVQSIYLSLDPSMRRRMGGLVPERGRSALGEVLGGCAVGRVVESLSDSFLVGDTVTGMLGW